MVKVCFVSRLTLKFLFELYCNCNITQETDTMISCQWKVKQILWKYILQKQSFYVQTYTTFKIGGKKSK